MANKFPLQIGEMLVKGILGANQSRIDAEKEEQGAETTFQRQLRLQNALSELAFRKQAAQKKLDREFENELEIKRSLAVRPQVQQYYDTLKSTPNTDPAELKKIEGLLAEIDKGRTVKDIEETQKSVEGLVGKPKEEGVPSKEKDFDKMANDASKKGYWISASGVRTPVPQGVSKEWIKQQLRLEEVEVSSGAKAQAYASGRMSAFDKKLRPVIQSQLPSLAVDLSGARDIKPAKEALVIELAPNASIAELHANFLWKKDIVSARNMAWATASKSRLETLKASMAKVDPSQFPTVNAFNNWTNRQLGDTDIIDLMTKVKTIVFEVARATGSGAQMSDTRVGIELENLDINLNKRQFSAAVDNSIAAVQAIIDTRERNVFENPSIDKTKDIYGNSLNKQGTTGTTPDGSNILDFETFMGGTK